MPGLDPGIHHMSGRPGESPATLHDVMGAMGFGLFEMDDRPRLQRHHLLKVISSFPAEVQGDDTQRSFWLSVAIIKHFLGLDWANQHMSPEGYRPGFLRVIPGYSAETQMSAFKVVDFAELLWNLETVPSFDLCLERLKCADIESTYAELDLGRMLYCGDVDFRFVKPQQIKGADYDIEIALPDWTVCADAKCKIETTEFSIETVQNSLVHARKQFPKGRPSFIFVKTPARWFNDIAVAVTLMDIARDFFRQTGRIVSIKYYMTDLVHRNGMLGHTHGFKELSNPNNRFDPTRNWDMFAEPFETTSWNGMPPKWKRLIFFPKDGPDSDDGPAARWAD
jgi:hypothetical protein